MSNQRLPSIITHPDHSKYQEAEKFHEAGYDSLLTATIMIRLAAKLGAERKKHDSPLISEPDLSKLAATDGDTIDSIRDGRGKAQDLEPLPPTSRQKRRQNRKKNKNTPEDKARRLQTKNIFDSLREMRLNPEDAATEPPSSPDSEPAQDFADAEASTNTWAESPAVEAGSWENEEYVQDKTGWVPIEQSERHAMEMIPKLEGDEGFWREFGNTLRVFGTEEAVLRIADW